VLLAYIGANLLITDRANAAVHRASPNAEAIFASPPPALFWRRDLVWLEGDCYRRSEFSPFTGVAPPRECQPNNMAEPTVREAIRRDPRLRKFLKWSILPQADVARGRCEAKVTIGDARYGEGRRSRLARETIVPTGAPGC
jgi:inner membrane protein